MTRITTCPDADAVAARACAHLARALEQAIEQRGRAHLALSGGTTPGHTYRLLAEEPVRWDAVDVWFADERCVAPDDPESNYLLARETLIEPGGIPPERVHRMRGELEPQEGARLYTLELLDVFAAALDSGEPVLDIVLLGIGPDGHVASLFPGAATLSGDHPPCIAIDDSPKPPPERLTLSLAVLRAARSCVLIATGASKADAVDAMLAEPSPHVPASLLRRERLTVMTDDAAAPGPAAR